MLSELVEGSFNAITVDSDTSTSDTVLLFATGAASKNGATPVDSADEERLKPFKKALEDLMVSLAHQIVRDGEGARKFLEVVVSGAESNASAKKIAFSIANSPLVKTAVAGEAWHANSAHETARMQRYAFIDLFLQIVGLAVNNHVSVDLIQSAATMHDARRAQMRCCLQQST